MLLGVGISQHVAAFEKEDHQRIAQVAKAFIAARNPWKDMKYRIEVDGLDPRTQLAKCPITPEAFLPPGARIKQRTTVGVRCPGERPWKIYLPVNIAAYAKVMVAKHPIGPGMSINDSDITWSERNISTLSYGYLRTLDDAGGYRARRAIAQGAVLTPAVVEADNVIQKGQRVELINLTGPIAVSMVGVAQESAALGALIRVKNLSSGKELQGVVQSSGKVVFR